MEQSQIDQLKSELVLKRLNSAEELRDWMTVYLGITFPSGTIHPTSTHAPVEAMWRIYELLKTQANKDIPQVTMLASRDSFKTLAASAIMVLLMVHFRLQLATAGAIKSQSDKMIQYVGSHFRKLKPFLEANGWNKISENKARTDWTDENGGLCFLRVVVATVAGMNSEHVPVLAIDEIDVVQDPRALEEGKMIPCVYKNSLGETFFPLTIYLSTRKYAGGLMEKVLRETKDAGGEILRWNILDVTERIPLKQAKVSEPKVLRYISTTLPMETLKPEDWTILPDESKNKYEKIEAYQGIADHPMLPIMKNRLVDRPQNDFGNLYKPITAVHNNFKQLDADMANAQLLCNKPSSSGLVYPRFSEVENVLTPRQAIEKVSGEEAPTDSFEYLKQYLKDLGITFIGGGDWGYTDHTSLVVLGVLPSGEVLHLDTIALPQLELDDIAKYVDELQQDWGIEKWYVDQAYPAYIKTLKRKVEGFKAPAFKKVVEDGIAAVQGKIVDSNNKRQYFIIDTPNNKCVIESFGTYSWRRDGKGDAIENKPDHGTDGTADIQDSIRYPFQNMFGVSRKINFSIAGNNNNNTLQEKIDSQTNLGTISREINTKIMKDKINDLATSKPNNKDKKNKRRIFWT